MVNDNHVVNNSWQMKVNNGFSMVNGCNSPVGNASEPRAFPTSSTGVPADDAS